MALARTGRRRVTRELAVLGGGEEMLVQLVRGRLGPKVVPTSGGFGDPGLAGGDGDVGEVIDAPLASFDELQRPGASAGAPQRVRVASRASSL